ncbi:MAG: histidine phosphatase family protein [Ruminococcaceae bacterium]|nr:histidine phosphatase family protein [Oscillospiraceae bacterium]
MTTLYFVRHAEPDYSNHDDMTRELSAKGLTDRVLVAEYLADKNIHAVLSSPFKRAVDTVRYFADSTGLDVITVNDFRERRVDSGWISDFDDFCKRQWSDFDYKLSDGETLREVQQRNIAALNNVLNVYSGKNIVIGTHGTALSTIINHYDSSFGYERFCEIKMLMPWVVRMEFEGQRFVSLHSVDLFSLLRIYNGGMM